MVNFYQDVITVSPEFQSSGIVNDAQLLEPVTRTAVLRILAEAQLLGVPLFVFETYRSRERQAELYLKRATQLKEVGVHHFGLAADLVRLVNGKPSWAVDYKFLGPLCQKHGLIWGGDWGFPDAPHRFLDLDHVQRVAVKDQERLLAGTWYPTEDYRP